jgi:hypothetical protein
MAHFAKLDENNVVVFVTVGRQEDDGLEDELSARTGDVYKQTSYNTRGGVHYDPVTGEPSADQSKAYRGNYAGIGYTYDETLDAFIPPQPYPSWVLNEETFSWEAPIPYPSDGKDYIWDESAVAWVEVEDEAV